MSPSRLLIYGFYGDFNAGDEAILYSLLSMLRSKAPDSQIEVVCTARRESASDWYQSLGVEPFAIRNLRRLLPALVRRRLIVGGGQMIAGDRSLKSLVLCLALVFVNRLAGKRPVLMGVGVEGVDRRRAKLLVKLIGLFATKIACRDQYSLEQLLAAGCSRQKLLRTADLVFSGELRNLAPPPDGTSRGSESLLLVLHRSPLRSYAAADAYAQAIHQIRQVAPGAELTVLAHDSRPDFDAGLLDELASLNEDEMVRFVAMESLPQVLREYARAKCIVSVRMHPQIIAATLGKPWVAVGGSNKVAALATRFAAPHAKTLAQVGPMLAKLLEESPAADPADLAQAEADAWKNIELVAGE